MCECKFSKEGHATKLARDGAARIGARLDPEASRALARLCSNGQCNTSEAIRRAIMTLAKADGDPSAKLADLIKVLALPANASAADVQAAVAAILGGTEPPAPADAGATGSGADQPPAAILSRGPEAVAKWNALRAQRRARATDENASRAKLAAHSKARAARTK
jgi:hypothetical protein